MAIGRTKELTPELKKRFTSFAKSLGLTDDYIIFSVPIGKTSRERAEALEPSSQLLPSRERGSGGVLLPAPGTQIPCSYSGFRKMLFPT